MANLNETIGTKDQEVLVNQLAHYLSSLTGKNPSVIKGIFRNDLADMIDRQQEQGLETMSKMKESERFLAFQKIIQKVLDDLSLDYRTVGSEMTRIYGEWKMTK